MAEQLTFHLPTQPALEREDFFVSPGNAAAVASIQGWQDWPQGKLVLVGPEDAGKSHLVHVWAALSGAQIVAAQDLAGAEIAELAGGAVAVEDADLIAGDAAAEEALFHLHNLALAQGQPLLITAQRPPARWQLQLPDLASRMQGSAMVTLAPPDDALLAAVLVKLFNDRQVTVDAALINYLVSRMERSFAKAGQLVAALDQAALAGKSKITPRLAGKVLDNMGRDTP